MSDDLQKLVVARLAELGDSRRPLSYRAAAARGRGHVSHGTIGRLVRGEHTGALEEETLDGLSLALNLPRSRLEKAAGIYRNRPAQPFVMPPRASRLSHREREVVLGVVDALLAAADSARSAKPVKSAPATIERMQAIDSRSGRRPSSRREQYDLVAYTSDGAGRISPTDLETIRRHSTQ